MKVKDMIIRNLNTIFVMILMVMQSLMNFNYYVITSINVTCEILINIFIKFC